MVKIVMHGKVKGFEGKGPLIAATDASYKARTAGIAYVISDGRWGLRQWAAQPRLDPTGPSRVLIAELRAVALLVEAPAGPRAAGLLVDSVNAIKYLRAWQAGDAQRMPDGYSLRPRWGHPTAMPTLARLAQIMAANPHLLLEHVPAHTGHPLNEAVDALASLARRGEPAQETRQRATGLVEAFLPIWHAQSARGASAA